MLNQFRRLYVNLPNGTHPHVRKWYHVVHPRASWRKRRKGDEVRAAFVDRFFDDENEFERYETEFFTGPIVDICAAGAEAMPDGKTVYDAHEDECARLYALVRKYEPETLVETGVYNGVSTASMLVALDENDAGTLHSVHYTPGYGDRPTDGDVNEPRGITTGKVRSDGGARAEGATTPDSFFERKRPSCAEPGTHELPPGRAPGWIIPDDLRDRWDLRIGRSRRVLPSLLPELGGVDLFVHDSEHSTSGMLYEFEAAWEWLVPGGMLVSFHVDWNDAFDTFVEERSAEHGLMTYTYSRKTDHDTPCTSGYAIRP